MSTIQTNAIVDAAGGNTATVNGVTPNTHSVRGRNILINGDMRIAQRGTSFTSPASGALTVDRWVSGIHTGTGAGNVTQESDAPTAAQSGTVFTHSLKLQVTTANTSIQATDRKYFIYKLEGQDVAQAGSGQAGTRYMTLSFWHKHTKTGIHSVAINNAARDRSYPMEYTQTTTNTWEKAELTFPVDTTGTWPTTNAAGMWLFFGAAYGSNYAATGNQWGAGQKYGTANQVNNYDSTSNSMQFTGVQLELGSVATEFEHRSYAEELAACQRYYFRNINSEVAGGANCRHYLGYADSSTAGIFPIRYPVRMRAIPTLSYSGTWNCESTSGSNATNIAIAGATTYVATVTTVSGAMSTKGYAVALRSSDTSAYIDFDAEL